MRVVVVAVQVLVAQLLPVVPVVADVVAAHEGSAVSSVEQVLQADEWARAQARTLIARR